MHIYAVTNWHVILEMSGKQGNINPVMRINTTDGEIDILETKKKDWIQHPEGHDLAVFPVEILPDHYQITPIFYTQLLTQHMMKEEGIGIGSDTISVGRFMTHEGIQKNTPVVRFGHVSMLPYEAIYNPSLHMGQESFLVECHSSNGYSGSPVFVETSTSLSVRHRILGVVWAHMDQYTRILDAEGYLVDPDRKVKYNTGMMAVIPSWRLIELLNLEELKEQRHKATKLAIEEQRLQDAGTTPDQL